MRLSDFTKCSKLSLKGIRLEVDESGKQWREKIEGDRIRNEVWKGERTRSHDGHNNSNQGTISFQ